MPIVLEPIGYVRTSAADIPRHWVFSDVEGTLVINKEYLKGLKDIKTGQSIVVIFYFDRSPTFNHSYMIQMPPHRKKKIGVFSICSPIRPNPIGMSVLEVLRIEENIIKVRGLDMLDGTPILDIKPHIEDETSCPSYKGGSS
ncbi:MAG: tRNA (N6-threonylcarbamoyladenosine(37)-N6)-methyltransferase TrmO [Deltaproteobacteria bacterium]|nr:tRNA (N6-threonylcarbamoyladenosine(37)-N6)-methyltransferase TrmO [Deltaproteobacteria bacterium]